MYEIGARVFWLRTLGGGGGAGHRPNPKEATPATVTKIGARRVQIQPDDRARSGPTWVSPDSLTQVVAHVSREIAEAFGMTNLPNTIIHDEPESSSPYTSTRYADEMPESDFYGEG